MKLLLYVSPALFLIACCLPALEFTNSSGPNPDIMLGLRSLAVGWSGIFAGVTAWYANVFWLAGVVLLYFKKPTPAIVAGMIALIISYSVFRLVGQVLPADEGNVNKMTVVRLLPGCYVWIASLAVMPISAIVQRYK